MSENIVNKFLVVDDEQDIREMIECALSSEGHSVSVAADRGEALEMLKTSKPDIMFLDLAMSGLGIEEFLHEARKISPSTDVVLMTAGYRAATKAEEFGISTYLQKPFELHALSRSAAAFCNRRATAG